MRHPLRVLIAAAAAASITGIGSLGASAERGPGGNTVPVSQGTSDGKAGFDPEGIHALANKPADGGQQVGLPNGMSRSSAPLCATDLVLVAALGCVPMPPGGAPVCPPATSMFTIGCLTPLPPSVPLLRPIAQPPATGPAALALQALGQKPWPRLQIGVNPGSSGLTGLPSWFWISGDPRVADATASVPGLDITVHAQLAALVWNFGDDRELDSGLDLGQPYPTTSTVQHLYETDSGVGGGYTVVCVLHYLVSYAVNGGPLQPLGEWLPTYTQSYVVKQLQPQAVPVPRGA